MRSGRTIRERGAALMMMLAIIVLGASWFLVRQLNAESGGAAAIRTARNAEVLNRAKQALIGYVAAQAANAGENDPGALPCPEAAGYFDNPDQEGQTASFCTLPKVGRFPWRSIGVEKLVDGSGEPLWYVVSPGWAVPNSTTNTNINSNSVGQLTVDGVANTAVALIIAPGPTFSVPACGANPAISQTRPTVGTPDWRNYLECENATYPTPDATFVTTGPAGAFNDQVVRVTVADIMPAIEAAVAKRIERDIVPALKSAYASSTWSLSSANPLFPYPARFPSGTVDPNTSTYQGAGTAAAGLLPVSSTSCTGDPRCSATFVAWNQTIAPTVIQTGGSGTLNIGATCSFSAATLALCTGTYTPSPSGTTQLAMTVRAGNVAMALRQIDATQAFAQYQDGTWTTAASSTTGSFVNDGSADIRITATFPSESSASRNFRMALNLGVLADHPVIKSTDTTYGWFVRNEWYRLLYYAPAPGNTAAALPSLPSCTTGSTCLSVTNVTPAGAQRAILILAGRSVNGSSRPSATLADYLEFGNATAAYERRAVNASNAIAQGLRFNDRVIVIDSN
jgi:hypothetical protein